MHPKERERLTKGYVIRRLREEVAAGKRGTQAKIAKALDTSSAHMANMLEEPPTRQPGEQFRRKVAAYWGMTYAELEAKACGDAPSPPPSSPSLTAPDLEAMRQMMREEILAALKQPSRPPKKRATRKKKS